MNFIKKNIQIIILGAFLVLSIVSYIYLKSSITSQEEVLVFEKSGRQKLEEILENSLILAEFENNTIEDFDSIEDISKNPIILKLDDLANDFLVSDSNRKYFSKDPKLLITGSSILVNWEALKSDFRKFYNDRDLEKFYKAGEVYFNNLNTTVTKVDKYIVSLESNIKLFKIYSIINICVSVLLIILMVLQKFLLEKNEKRKKENEEKLAIEKELANIDEETKLHSKLKCEELFDTPVDLSAVREISMLMFGLSNLKKASNSNALILGFAKILKDAVAVLGDNPFVARYDRDEFLVYIEKTNENDIKSYIEKINELVDVFNESDEIDKVDEVAEIVETNEADESTEVDETAETNEVAEANETDETNEADEADEADEANEVDEVDETDEADEANEVDEVDETDEANEVDETPEINKTISKLSYAIGHSITTEGAENITLKELFDVAISDMKHNKEVMEQK